MTGDIQVRYNDFKGGDWGARDAGNADRDQWKGRDMVVYRSGLLGPRSGFGKTSYAALPPLGPFEPGGFGSYGDRLLMVIGSTIYSLRDDLDDVTTPYANYPVAPTDDIQFLEGNNTLYSLTGGVLYKHVAGGATTVVTTPVAFETVTRWGLWMVATASKTSSPSPRIYFSLVDASGSNFDSWPANNFYDVGNSDGITALESIFNTLYVGKQQSWWAVTGVLGDLASIRAVAVGNGPMGSGLAATTADNQIAYWSGRGVTNADLTTPAFFGGASRPQLALDWRDKRAVNEYGTRVVPMSDGEVVFTHSMFPNSTDLLLRHPNGSFTRHRAPLAIAGWAPAEIRESGTIGIRPGVLCAARRSWSIEPVEAYVASWVVANDRPGHTGDADQRPDDLGSGTLVTGTLSLPAHYEPNGRQLLVRRVIIQFRKWPSGIVDSSNLLRVRVDALGQFGNGTATGTAQTWTELSALAAGSNREIGVDDSVRFDFGDQGYGNGFQIVFEAVAGVGIREVIAEVEVQRGR